jgi:hypothetical protein
MQISGWKDKVQPTIRQILPDLDQKAGVYSKIIPLRVGRAAGTIPSVQGRPFLSERAAPSEIRQIPSLAGGKDPRDQAWFGFGGTAEAVMIRKRCSGGRVDLHAMIGRLAQAW